VDGDVIRAAEQGGCIVVTNDLAVKRALLERGLGVVTMRGRQRLEFIRG
jgi:rRNA-processing protein FCF1